MTHIAGSKVRQDLSDTLNRVAYGRQRIILERRRKEIAAVIPIEDLRLLEALEDRIDLADAHAALAEAKKKGTKSLEVIVKELGL
jgi:prevent-host-death family protein